MINEGINMNFLTPCLYAAVLLVGILFKSFKVLPENAHKTLYKVMLNVTLPMAVICAFENFNGDATLFTIIPLGLVCSFLPFITAFLCTFKLKREDRAFYMFNSGGFNIGCIALAVVSGVYGELAPVAACLFDTGNALVVTGGSYSVSGAMLKGEGEKQGVLSVFKRLFSSVPFDTYLIMLVVSVCGLKIPSVVVQFVRPVANANGFLAMFSAGCLLDLKGVKPYVKSALKVVAIRLCLAVAFASLFYFALPFDQTVRNALVMVAFAPISALAPMFTEKAGGDGARSGFALSLSVVISILCMLALSFVLPT